MSTSEQPSEVRDQPSGPEDLEGQRQIDLGQGQSPPLVVLRPDATDEELQKACDIMNEARRQWLRELGRAVTDKDY